ncbi:uncharacterized protein PITG_14551 [Phytophthora infestans T30-4]|uniref:Uncharacterized protein n=1 Tax=Phytophthora infestans (strain T30-4) TaxID=403677 RepID=D0NQI4_PHYIT|nr:uncharacterized protein PITG_14551 [Phytophthora infestans T30-4]EEY62932.1 hypothetical protein PITG_14551 [Phytophthora infestans T30-4]|eukprot:XP_002898455.1 hypothetical protein PITG_14551 [Phytophthora infestans T30-4]
MLQPSQMTTSRNRANCPARVPRKIVSLSANYRQSRREYAEILQQATSDAKATREFQRRVKHASFEHRERKLAVQALQARIKREIQFLIATAADLEKREFLLDDAFESYERALRLELASSQRFY